MKIDFLIRKVAGRSGGAERVLIETANEMANRGHVVRILSHEARASPPFYDVSGPRHINLFKRPASRSMRILHRMVQRARLAIPDLPSLDRIKWEIGNRRFVRDVEHFLKRSPPDVVVAWMPPAFIGAAMAETSIPIVFSTHNAPAQDFENPKRWDQSPHDRRLRMKLLSRVHRITVLLPEYRDWYPPELRDRISVVPNPVKAVNARRDGLRQNRVIVVGRLAEVKRPLLMVDAWAQLSPMFPDWRLDFFGEGPLTGAVTAHIATHNLKATAAVRGVTSRIEAEYMSASLLCHPAEYEGFPLAVSEALAYGVPVIGFEDCSGLNALVTNGKNGLLVNPAGDRLEAYVNGVASLLADPQELARLGAAAPGSVTQYRPDLIYDLWERVITTAALEPDRKGSRPCE